MNNQTDIGGEYYRRWIEGDEEAFGLLIALYRKNLIFFVNRILDNPTLSEQVAVDSFAELIIHKNSYTGKTTLKTYLYSIAQYKAFNILRERKHYTDEPLPEDIEDYYDIERELIKTEQKEALHKAIKALPNDMSEAVYLYWFEEMSYNECAKIMNITPKRVDNLLYRAKIKLKELLSEEDGK